MNKKLKNLLSVVLSIVLVVMTMIPASASGRRINYLSELQMAQAKDEETAKKMLTDKGYVVLDTNLNPGGDEVVFLGYKTSSNVEDAITDISVMNMNGGFNITDYETIMAESLEEYKSLVVNFRTAAEEFEKNYKDGKKEALLAYTQLNYYYTEEAELDKDGEAVLDDEGNPVVIRTYMGDYMLDFPENDEDFADILFKGNTNILNNIRSLLAMGVARGSIVDRIKTATEDETVYEKVEYYDLANNIAASLSSLKSMKDQAQEDYESIMADETLTEEQKTDIAYYPQQTLATVLAIETMLSKIPYGDSNYGEYVASGVPLICSDFYPFVEVMTKGQRALVATGQFIPVMIYDEVELTQEEIDEQLGEIERSYLEQSVYLGTDMGLYEGSFAVTKGAINRESTTGESVLGGVFGEDGSLIASAVLTAAGAIITTASLAYLATNLGDVGNMGAANAGEALNTAMIINADDSLEGFDMILENTATNNANTISNVTNVGGAVGISLLTMTLGAFMLAIGIYNFVTIVNKFKVDYTDIPANMIENVETVNGDRYIRYSVVNSFYEADGKIKERAGDTNAYDGYQWNAIYYTKNYEAGKCIIANADWPTAEADFGKYSPVHPFGMKDICYDLNDFTDGNEDESIFLAFQNSNNQKAAASNVPTVVGSAFSFGSIAVSGIVGLVLGMVVMSRVKGKKKEG